MLYNVELVSTVQQSESVINIYIHPLFKKFPSHLGHYRSLSPWSRVWQPTPVFLPGEFHGQRSVACCRPRDRKEWDTTERLTDAHAAYTAFRVHHVAACVRIPFVCEAAYYSIVGMYYSLFIRLYIIHLCIVC